MEETSALYVEEIVSYDIDGHILDSSQRVTIQQVSKYLRQFLDTNTRSRIIAGVKGLRFTVTKFPLVLKTLSDGTLVATAPSHFHASSLLGMRVMWTKQCS